MTDYGLTPQGFNPKTADVISAELDQDIRTIDGLEDINTTDPASGWAQLIAILTEREALLWALILLVWQSAFRDYATGLSLDNAISLIGKARHDERHSTVILTLYNRTSASPTTVPADSQARQGATGVIWETIEDAEIPALTTLHSGLDVANITWQSGNIVRATVPAVDYSAVAVGDDITLSGCTNASNNGTFSITTVNDASNWFEYLNPNRSSSTGDETGSPGLADIDDTETSITVNAQSYSAGAYEASAGSINQIVTAISGWDGVSNADEALVGREQETDTATRRRVAGETVSAQGGTLAAVKQKLENLEGVTYVSARENESNVAAGGLKPNSMHFVIVGGDDAEIINTIGTYGPAGIATNGSESGVWTQPNGDPLTIYFDRVDEVMPYLVVTLSTTAEFPSDGQAQIIAALEGVSWTHGEDLKNYKLIGAVSSLALAGLEDVDIAQGLTPGPVSSANTTIGATEVVNITADRISFA